MTELARMFPCDSESKNLQNPVENVGIMWYTLFAAGIRASRSVGVGCWYHLKRNFGRGLNSIEARRFLCSLRELRGKKTFYEKVFLAFLFEEGGGRSLRFWRSLCPTEGVSKHKKIKFTVFTPSVSCADSFL